MVMSDDPAMVLDQRREDGYYTVGMLDFEYNLPTSNAQTGCDGRCGSSEYPDPKPQDWAMKFY
ncbi:hypothetical protein LTR66_002151 [Elasticomyces elasticus]|nr:hypothetical protein LTR28_010324 [Elasticomyces elasticus]KAK4998647.1 hypothetical protein LTR66_002151 [Elasticomyces elasticus]